VEALLRRSGYRAHANWALLDQHLGKAREVDVGGIRVIWQFNNDGEPVVGVAVTVVFECINNSQPIAFLTKEPQDRDDLYESVRLVGFPTQVNIDREEEQFQYIPRFIQARDYHHYFVGKLATQWCTFSKKANSDWMASHSRSSDKVSEEGEFDCITKLGKAIEFVGSEFTIEELVEQARSESPLVVDFVYPILVVQGSLWEVELDREELQANDTQHVRYLHQTILKDKDLSCCIDVVREQGIAQLLDEISREAQAALARLGAALPLLEDARELAAAYEKLTPKVKRRIFSTEDDPD
jgi:hypothetical protein